MEHLSRLAELADRATEGQPLDEAVDRTLAIMREGLGASDACMVQGKDGTYRAHGAADTLGLSQVALWFVQRELIARATPCLFKLRDGRVESFLRVAPGAHGDYLAALLPAAERPTHMLVARGPWGQGIGPQQTAFLRAALVTVGHLVERVQTFEEAGRNRRMLGVLAGISSASETESIETVLTRITHTVAAVAAVDYVSIDLVDAGNRITLRCVNVDEQLAGGALRKRRKDPVGTAVLETRQPLVFSDVQNDERMTPEGRAYFARSQIRSVAVLPLVASDTAVGVLGLASSRRREFAGEELELLQGLAQQVANVVHGMLAREAIRAIDARLQAVIANAPIVLFALDRDGVFTLSEGKGLEPMGLRPGAVVGRSAFDIYANDPQVVENLRRALAGDTFTSVTAVSDLAFETYYAPLRDSKGEISGIIGVATDVTERTRTAAALIEQARRDSLTGLLNHASITQELHDAAAMRASFAVVIIDVDGLKAVNDTYGHHMGDELLTFVAGALGRDNAVAGRYGGDEFQVIVPGADRVAAARYVESLSTEFASARLTDADTGASVAVVASMGFAVYPVDAETPDTLVRLADAAMYAHKRTLLPGAAGISSGRSDERAAATVGELLPLLTSPGTLEEKLRLVSHRLSVGAGYDVVMFETYAARDAEPAATNTFARLPDELLDQWNQEQRGQTRRPLEDVFMQTRRAVILDDPQNDERLTEGERAILRAAGLYSAISVPMFWQDELVGSLNVACKRANAFTPHDAQFLTSVASQVTAIMRMATLVDDLAVTSERLQQSQADAIILLAVAAEAHDQGTGAHLQRVRVLSTCLARELGYSEKDAEQLGMAAVLHDIGKIRVPDAILISPAQLSDVEWSLMKQHTVWGADFLSARPGFELGAAVAAAHHERWDGTGYPAGLRGDEIPVAAAIVSVADALDAMTHDRPYRTGRSIDWAISEIEAGAGTQFSPRVVEALVRIHLRGALPPAHGLDGELREAA